MPTVENRKEQLRGKRMRFVGSSGKPSKFTHLASTNYEHRSMAKKSCKDCHGLGVAAGIFSGPNAGMPLVCACVQRAVHEGKAVGDKPSPTGEAA